MVKVKKKLGKVFILPKIEFLKLVFVCFIWQWNKNQKRQIQIINRIFIQVCNGGFDDDVQIGIKL